MSRSTMHPFSKSVLDVFNLPLLMCFRTMASEIDKHQELISAVFQRTGNVNECLRIIAL